jgi:hypothetical protein
MEGVFSVNSTTNRNQVKINHLGNISKEDSIIDSIIDKDRIQMTHFYTESYKCNLSQNYLMSTKTLPILYTNIMYSKSVVIHLLARASLMCDILNDVQSQNQLLENNLNSRLYLSIDVDNQTKVIEVESFTSDIDMIKYIKNVVSDESFIKQFNSVLEKKELERISRMSLHFNAEFRIPKATV